MNYLITIWANFLNIAALCQNKLKWNLYGSLHVTITKQMEANNSGTSFIKHSTINFEVGTARLAITITTQLVRNKLYKTQYYQACCLAKT